MERREYYGGGIALVGVVLTLIQLFQGVQQLEGHTGLSDSDLVIIFAFETVPFVIIGASLIYVGYWLSRQPTYETDLQRICLWGTGSAIMFASVSALILFSQQVTSHTLEQGGYIAMNQITVGAVVGVLVGLYDARGRLRQRELRTETLEEVGSLCIQAVRTVLGITELAVVATDRGDRELLDNTVVSASEETLLGVAEASLGQEPGSVAVDSSPPPSVDGEKQVVSALVAEQDELSVVLIALADEANTPGTEEVELLEMLVAHAATAVERAHGRPLSPAKGEAAGTRD